MFADRVVAHVPVLIHILAPNMRPVQVTRYLAIRAQLAGRCPQTRMAGALTAGQFPQAGVSESADRQPRILRRPSAMWMKAWAGGSLGAWTTTG